MILGYSFLQIVWYFVIYSFIGWCVEVVYCTVNNGHVVNRGFLNGPVCPIYGFGMVGVLCMLRLFGYTDVAQAGFFTLFFGGMILASSVELFGGWLLMKLFHTRWWDYTGKPFNLGGYICLEFSIFWGLGAVLVMRVVHAAMSITVESSVFSTRPAVILLIFLCLLYFADTVVTIFTVIGLNKDLEELDKINATMRVFSDKLSTNLGNSALETNRRADEGRVQMVLATAEAKEKAAAVVEAAEDSMWKARREAAEKMGDAKQQVSQAGANLREAISDTRAAAGEKLQTAVSMPRTVANEKLGELKQAADSMTSSVKDRAGDAALQMAMAKADALGLAVKAKSKAFSTGEEYRTALEERAEALRQDILQKQWFGGARLLNAFPTMRHERYGAIIEELKAKLHRS